MKILQRGIMKIAPGKMAEAMELNQKLMDAYHWYEDVSPLYWGRRRHAHHRF